ncbi:TadE family protein [Streptomyces boninensis]|uniref:TadE family protein n=1 Tax=Streptomyces boninensis TaxID=2039455 RepID=UPI003B223BCB
MKRHLTKLVRSRLDACRGERADRGVTAIEFVFLTPLLFFMIFATVQFGLYFFADHVAQAAAQAGARKARQTADANPGGWQGLARDKANTYIQQLGPQLLDNPAVETLPGNGETVGVRVRADVPSVFPGMTFSVESVSQGPVERFVEDDGG